MDNILFGFAWLDTFTFKAFMTGSAFMYLLYYLLKTIDKLRERIGFVERELKYSKERIHDLESTIKKIDELKSGSAKKVT